MGYCLTAATDQQKVLLIVGPPRSGKGTIARVMSALVGDDHVVRPTLSSLAKPFGLEQLIGKSLAIVPDARLGKRIDQAELVERVLSISGEDCPAVDRKFQPAWNGRLAARLVVITNEVPNVRDVSGALAGRMLVFALTESFAGREDTGLTDGLLAELPGIAQWAIQGLRELRQAGRFTQPASGAEVATMLRDAASELHAFIAERCELKADAKADPDGLRDAFNGWRQEQGYETKVSKPAFGRLLFAACPGIKRTQGPRELGRRWHYDGIRLLPASSDPSALPI